jgi:acyl-CoA thioester hydrolase
MTHRLGLRVYHEDTDLAGIVYYANYLKFIERGRSEWVRGLGLDQAALKAGPGIVFAVRRLQAEYLRPARFDDWLEVATRPEAATAARITLCQEVWRSAERLFAARVELVALTPAGRPARLPAVLRAEALPAPGRGAA